jgi:glycosyltransferase involved in cell wall biosynthesis
MRILMITPSFHPVIGGVETHVRRVSECLAARGHQITVLTHSDEPGDAELGPLTIHRLPRTNWWRAWQASRPHIAAADIVHCHDAYSFLHFYLPSCYLGPRRPVFATFHGYESYPIRSEALRWRAFVRRRVKDALCMGEFICRWYGTKCAAVSYGGVDPGERPPLPQRPGALFIGRLAEDTSIMFYLHALALLKSDRGRTLPLTVLGDGPMRQPAEMYAKAQRLDTRFLSAVPNPDEYLALADVAFVSGYLSIWQALAARRLVFAVYENELKRDYLTCFPEADKVMMISGEADELADQLLHYLDNRDMYDDKRDLGARLAAENTWDRVADLYRSMYSARGYT